MTGYRAQTAELKKRSKHDYPCKVTTIDAMQGLENDVVIVSLVRTGDKIGFLDDLGRKCVLMSRAKTCLLIIGSLKTFAGAGSHNAGTTGTTWRNIADCLFQRGYLYEGGNSVLKKLNKVRG